MFGIDKPTEDLEKHPRPKNKRDRTHALKRALEFPLLPFAHAVRHHALRGRHRNVPERDDWNRSDEQCARFCDAGDKHSCSAEKLTNIECHFFAKAFHHSSGQAAGNNCRNDSDEDKRVPGVIGVPGISIHAVKSPDAEDIVGEICEELNRGQPPEFMMRAQKFE